MCFRTLLGSIYYEQGCCGGELKGASAPLLTIMRDVLGLALLCRTYFRLDEILSYAFAKGGEKDRYAPLHRRMLQPYVGFLLH